MVSCIFLKQVKAHLIITDLPSFYKGLKKLFLLVSRKDWEFNPKDVADTLHVPWTWYVHDNLGKFLLGKLDLAWILLTLLFLFLLGIRPNLSAKDKIVLLA